MSNWLACKGYKDKDNCEECNASICRKHCLEVSTTTGFADESDNDEFCSYNGFICPKCAIKKLNLVMEQRSLAKMPNEELLCSDVDRHTKGLVAKWSRWNKCR